MEVEKLIEKLSQEQNESSKVVRIALAYAEFVSLVKRMREAQIEKDESDQGYRAIPHICILEKKDRLESEVDEYLKRMEEQQ